MLEEPRAIKPNESEKMQKHNTHMSVSAVITALIELKGELMKPLIDEQRDYLLKAQRQLGEPGKPLTDSQLAHRLGLSNERRVRRWKSISNPSVMGGMAYQAIENMLQAKKEN